jgi:hypothetical protein
MTNATSRRAQYSASLSVSSTQNTAPIIEYRCLYSHDLRRKAKRWQDGFLRFHTFNKRVMVYDVLRNFIGDTHWREKVDVCDGTELKLERGILVEVSEEVERVEQNRNEVLKKVQARKDDTGSDREAGNSRPTTASGMRAQGITLNPAQQNSTFGSTLTSQLQPRSLNSLLGISRGQRGRGLLPEISPYAQRQADIRAEKRSDAILHPPKRRKTDLELQLRRETSPVIASKTALPRPPTTPPVFAPPPPQVSQALKRRTENPRTTDEESVSLPTLSRQVVRPPPPRIIEIDSDDGVISLNPIKKRGSRQRKATLKTKNTLKKKEKQPSSIVKTVRVSPSKGPPPNPIRIAAKKTRRKLFCAAPSHVDNTHANASDINVNKILPTKKSKDTDKGRDEPRDTRIRNPARQNFDVFELSESGSDDDYFQLQEEDHVRNLPLPLDLDHELSDKDLLDPAATRDPSNSAIGRTNVRTAHRHVAVPFSADGSPERDNVQEHESRFLPPDSPPPSNREDRRPTPDPHLINHGEIDPDSSPHPSINEPFDSRPETHNNLNSNQLLMPIIHLYESPEPETPTDQHPAPLREGSTTTINFAAHLESFQVDGGAPTEVQQDKPLGQLSSDSHPAEEHPLTTTVNGAKISNAPLLSKPFKKPTVKKRFDVAKAAAGTVGLKQIGVGEAVVQVKDGRTAEKDPRRDDGVSEGRIVDRDIEAGPWSREAYDLFTWRPPPRRVCA